MKRHNSQMELLRKGKTPKCNFYEKDETPKWDPARSSHNYSGPPEPVAQFALVSSWALCRVLSAQSLALQVLRAHSSSISALLRKASWLNASPLNPFVDTNKSVLHDLRLPSRSLKAMLQDAAPPDLGLQLIRPLSAGDNMSLQSHPWMLVVSSRLEAILVFRSRRSCTILPTKGPCTGNKMDGPRATVNVKSEPLMLTFTNSPVSDVCRPLRAFFLGRGLPPCSLDSSDSLMTALLPFFSTGTSSWLAASSWLP